jgi:lysophospholipase L1-like esterase
LEKQAPGQFEVINAGVIGYTSHQGLRLLKSKVLHWPPNLVTVYFGWNDHWLALGLEDKQQTAGEPSGIVNSLDSLRLFQLARMLRKGTKADRIAKLRVEPEDYQSNLSRIQELCSAQDVQTWYLTAPHALDIGIPPYLLTSGEILDPDGLIPLHQKYNTIVRAVAKQQKADLVDLESEMDQMDKPTLFVDDHIHLSQRGRLYVAQRIVQTLQQRGILGLDARQADQ